MTPRNRFIPADLVPETYLYAPEDSLGPVLMVPDITIVRQPEYSLGWCRALNMDDQEELHGRSTWEENGHVLGRGQEPVLEVAISSEEKTPLKSRKYGWSERLD